MRYPPTRSTKTLPPELLHQSGTAQYCPVLVGQVPLMRHLSQHLSLGLAPTDFGTELFFSVAREALLGHAVDMAVLTMAVLR